MLAKPQRLRIFHHGTNNSDADADANSALRCSFLALPWSQSEIVANTHKQWLENPGCCT